MGASTITLQDSPGMELCWNFRRGYIKAEGGSARRRTPSEDGIDLLLSECPVRGNLYSLHQRPVSGRLPQGRCARSWAVTRPLECLNWSAPPKYKKPLQRVAARGWSETTRKALGLRGKGKVLFRSVGMICSPSLCDWDTAFSSSRLGHVSGGLPQRK